MKGFNTNATKESGEPSHARDSGPDAKANPGGRSVWWRWTAPSVGTVTLDTKGSYFDTILGVYTGSSLSGLTSIA
ncbi:MAG: calcium-binding protein, partial [Oleiharenicola lentus]